MGLTGGAGDTPIISSKHVLVVILLICEVFNFEANKGLRKLWFVKADHQILLLYYLVTCLTAVSLVSWYCPAGISLCKSSYQLVVIKGPRSFKGIQNF